MRAYAELHTRQPRLHRVLFEESPRPPELLARFHRAVDDAGGAVERLLREDPALDLPDPARSARVVITTVESLVHRFVDRPELVGEIVPLVTGYLLTGGRGPVHPS